MVLISMTFTVQPDNHAAFERTWRQVFMPAVAAWAGFLECRLLRPWASEDDSTSGTLRVDLLFGNEELRSAWVNSPEHGKAFAELAELADGFTVTRHLVAAATPPAA